MKNSALIILALATTLGCGQAATLLSQDYSTFTNGPLVGQGGWAQIGSTITNPITVTLGSIGMTTTGQDAGVAFSSAVNSGDLTASFSLSLSAAQSGDYFLAFNTGATSTNYNSRVFAKSSGTGFVLGLQMGVTGATPTYGTTELSFGTIYNVTLTHTFVAGAANDTGSLMVNGTSYTGLVTWAGTSTEDASLGAISLRQGTAGSAATISAINGLTVTGQAVPEPGTVALVGLGLGAVLFGTRRKRVAA